MADDSPWLTVGDPLRDANGEPFDPNALPCYWQPDHWDEDASLVERKRSAARCRSQCPALAACAARLAQLGWLATGVWAGRVLPRNASERVAFVGDHDAVVARWIADSGVKIPVSPDRGVPR